MKFAEDPKNVIDFIIKPIFYDTIIMTSFLVFYDILPQNHKIFHSNRMVMANTSF